MITLIFYQNIVASLQIMTFLERWADFAHLRVNETIATFASGALVANGIDERLTLADWSTILGMIYISTMLVPRLFDFVRWIYKKIKSKLKGE